MQMEPKSEFLLNLMNFMNVSAIDCVFLISQDIELYEKILKVDKWDEKIAKKLIKKELLEKSPFLLVHPNNFITLFFDMLLMASFQTALNPSLDSDHQKEQRHQENFKLITFLKLNEEENQKAVDYEQLTSIKFLNENYDKIINYYRKMKLI